MATTLRTLPKFYGLTSSKFNALKSSGSIESNALYFVFDAGSNGMIYRGSNVYGESIRYVNAMPAAGDALYGIVYFNQSNGIAYVKQNASTVVPIGVTTVSHIVDSDVSQNGEVPNIGAVKEYVKAKVATVFTYKGVVDTVAELPGLEATSDETAVAGKTYYSKTGDVYAVLDLPVGATVPEGTYEGPKVGDLFNVVTGEDGTSAEYAWTDKGEGVFDWEKLGSTIDYSIFMSKVTGASSGNLAVYAQGGQVEDANVTYSVASALPTVESAASNVLVNELEVANASSALASATTAASSALNESITNASSALDSSITAASAALSGTISATSSALDSKIDALGVDAIHKGTIDGTTNASEIIVVGGETSNVSGVATGKYLGGSTFAAESADVTMATEAGVSAYVTPISSALNTSITNASSALDSALTAASSALDADKMDKVPAGSGGIVLISKDDGNSELTGYVTGGSAIPTVSGAITGSGNVLATEEAVVTLVNELAWNDVE